MGNKRPATSIDWDSIVAAMERGEDVEERLDEVAGTGLQPRDRAAERAYEETRRREREQDG